MLTKSRKYFNQTWIESLFKQTTALFALLVFILLAAILISLVIGSWESIKRFGGSFLLETYWDPVQEQYGAIIPILGTLITAGIALFIAVPISFGIAIFLTELAPNWLKRPISIAIEMLAAIPSIIYGMWGLFVFVPLFQEHIQPVLIDNLGSLPGLELFFSGVPFGVGLFTAGLVLAIMIIPFIASVMRDVFSIVQPMLKEGAYGLGATTWEVVRQVIVPHTRIGLVGSVMLGLGRALGETMAITFIIGNSFQLPNSLFSPSTSIASAIANEFNEAGGLQKSALMELGLLLFVITTMVLILSRLMITKMQQTKGK